MKTLFLKKQTEGAQQRFDVFCNKNENDAHRALFTKEYLTKDIKSIEVVNNLNKFYFKKFNTKTKKYNDKQHD